ncbi:MAG: glycosyltransferase family 87 protein [Bryobacteraceae bacterium]
MGGEPLGRSAVVWASVFACLAGIAVNLWIGLRAPERGSDWNQFYSASKLAGSGHLYEYDRIRRLELQNGKIAIPFGRAPIYAAILKPLTSLPYATSRAAWLALSVLAITLFVVLWPGIPRREACMMLCWSCPLAILLSTGQDTALFLFLVAAALRLLEYQSDFTAGLILSLCGAKFHLGLGIPVFLVARGRWRALAGGLAGAAVQVGLSFWIEGLDWPRQLLRLSSISDFSPSPAKMPNLLGLTHWLTFNPALEAVLAFLALVAVWVIARNRDLHAGAAAAITAGLLASHHSYVYDCVLLLPGIMLALQAPVRPVLRSWALVLCVPVPYLFLMQESAPLVGQIAINGFSLSLLGTLAIVCHREKMVEIRNAILA